MIKRPVLSVVLSIGLLACCVSTAWADTTYSYLGSTFDNAGSPFVAGVDRVSFAVTLDPPLPANFSGVVTTPQISALSASAGYLTIDLADANEVDVRFAINGSGTITEWMIFVHTATNQAITSCNSSVITTIPYTVNCQAGVEIDIAVDPLTGGGGSASSNPGSWTAVAFVPVPALVPTSLAGLSLVLGAGGIRHLRRNLGGRATLDSIPD
jgi:hypothetical protein